LQEIKLSDINFDHSKLFQKNFLNIVTNISRHKGFSGTSMYSNIPYLSKSFCENIDIKNEGRIIQYQFKKLILFNVYFPNGKLNKERFAYKINFYKAFLNYCQELKKVGFSIIICGDFNTAHTNLDVKPSKIYSQAGFTDFERAIFNNFLKVGFIDTFRYIHGNIENAYTLFPYRSKAREKNEGWRIDYILVSEDLKDKLEDAFILNGIFGSDHCPIGIKINIEEYYFN